MGRRSELRAAVNLAVSLSGLDPEGNAIVKRATIVDVSHHGARVRVMGLQTAPGAIFNVVYEGKRAKYRVVWVGEANTERSNEIGLAAVDPAQCIWDMPTGEFWRDDFELESASQGSVLHSEENANRRKFERVKCSGSAKLVCRTGNSFPIGGRVSDISLGGCYVECHLPVPIDTQLDFELTFEEGVVCGQGTVRTSHPGVGLGLRFDSFGDDSLLVVERLITGTSGQDVVIRVKLESNIFSRLCAQARHEQRTAEEIASKMLKESLERQMQK